MVILRLILRLILHLILRLILRLIVRLIRVPLLLLLCLASDDCVHHKTHTDGNEEDNPYKLLHKRVR